MSSDLRSDTELIRMVARGNMAALGELVRRHQTSVLATAYRLLGRWDLAEDVAQDVFVRVLRSAPRYEPTAKVTTWLYRIAVNRCLDLTRRQKRAPLALAGIRADPPDDPPGDPVEGREVAEQVRRAVAGLPDRQRATIVLHRYEGLSHHEIAEITGWTESAVESLLVRGYANLRKVLANLDENDQSDRGEMAG